MNADLEDLMSAVAAQLLRTEPNYKRADELMLAIFELGYHAGVAQQVMGVMGDEEGSAD